MASRPWEIQDGESARQFALFALYRDMGPDRSVHAVGKAVGRTNGTVNKTDQTASLQE